jgi:sulfur transfer complex TusBCD TusB component (DsrH family)
MANQNNNVDYEDLFDFTEYDVPLSRLINNLLKTILKEYDGLLVLEDGVKTICIKAN